MTKRGRTATGDGGDELPPDDVRPKISTPVAQRSAPTWPPAEGVIALRIVGARLPEVPLPPGKMIFNLGSDDHPDIDIRVSSKLAKNDPNAQEHVSRLHLRIQRKGSKLWIRDEGSTNGTFIKDRREAEGYIGAGDMFQVGTDVTLLAMDQRMCDLRPTLRWALGFDDHTCVDGVLSEIHEGGPLLLVGPRACEQRFLAEQIHATSERRAHGFVAAGPQIDQSRAADLATASRGTLFVNLAEHRRHLPSWYVEQLFGDTYQIRPIVAAPRIEDATEHLGDRNISKLALVSIPPIAKRTADVPGILAKLFRDPPLKSERSIYDLGDKRLEKLKAFDWPDNFEDLRRNAPRILAFIIAGFNVEAAAKSLQVKRQSLADALERIGLLP